MDNLRNMRISEFLRRHLCLEYMNDELALLDELAGKQVAAVTFFPDAGWMNWRGGEVACLFLARYFIPIAEIGETWVGIHLLPSHVASERFAIAELDLECDHLIDHAYSARAYVYRKLLELEADGELQKSDISNARAILGADFYEPGQHGRFPASELERVMLDRFGGAPIDYKELRWFAQSLRKSVDEQIHWLECASEAFPKTMYFHANLARLYEQQGDGRSAACSVTRSLECYHHTAHYLGHHLQSQRDLTDYYAWGRQLLERVPTEFSEMARRDLLVENGESRIEWIVSLFQAGKVETSLRLLSDFRRDSGADLHTVLFKFLQRHYEQLGWEWATVWCEMCAAGARVDCENYTYMGQPHDGKGFPHPNE